MTIMVAIAPRCSPLPSTPTTQQVDPLPLYACANAHTTTTTTTHMHTTQQVRCRAWPSRAHVRTWRRASLPTSFQQPPHSPLLLLLLRPLRPRPTTPTRPPSWWNPGRKNDGQWTRWSRCARKPWPTTVVSWRRKTRGSRQRRLGWAAATAVEVYAHPHRQRCASLGKYAWGIGSLIT